MLPVSPSIRYRISAPAGERASGVEGNDRVCIENLRVLPTMTHEHYSGKAELPNGYCPNHATGVKLPEDFAATPLGYAE